VLIDKYMPSFETREHHETLVPADAARAYAALRALDFTVSPIVRALFAIRTIPERWRNRRSVRPAADRGPRPFLETALSIGWKVLEESPGEELVAGAVTQPWAPVVVFRGMPGAEFLAFAEPGFAKIVWNISSRPAGAGLARIATETRVATTDPASRRKFRRYWLVFGPWIGLIRMIALRRLRRQLERER
jgi:hypothetical protein